MSTDPKPAQFHGADAPVHTYVSTDIVAIAADAPIRVAATMIADASVGVLVVGSRDAVAALVSERDIVRAVAAGIDLDTTPVADIASPHVIWIDAGNTISDAAEEMMEDYVRHVLVRDDSGLVGVLSIRDVLDAYIT